ncbi:molybdopterin cofactor-binding domain-containing protein [Fodinicurvata halophila]|uniref:molybdopterin cofactor-binding domain-containing protein n=1 Tax=Fodinicurvata halophila TaxID=1419723 RepID=UPI0036293C10
MALEIAMDEMAEKLDMDPVEFRVVNDTQVDPENPDRPFSQRRFVECLRRGAEAFDWSSRNTEPGRLRDGEWLIGHGVAGAYRGAPAAASGARVRLRPNGSALVETDMTDIGTGSYTIIAQTAAEMLGLPIEQVDVDLGDSRAPVSSGSGGQWGRQAPLPASMPRASPCARRLPSEWMWTPMNWSSQTGRFGMEALKRR